MPVDQSSLAEESARTAETSTGILPAQELQYLINVTKEIFATDPIEDAQVQPASLDLRLGSKAYRVRASFLPGKDCKVQSKLNELAMHEMDISEGGVLERGCVYIVPLLEHVELKYRVSGFTNPKSSTGRLDIFVRVITDNGTEFDRIKEGYKGPLFAEISPRTFSVLVRRGSRLTQLRIRRGTPPSSAAAHLRFQEQFQLVNQLLTEDQVRNGVPISVDVRGSGEDSVIGYKAKNHAGLIDVDRVAHYDPLDFWDPVLAPKKHGLILDPADFYILVSQEAVKVPPSLAAEMIAYDTLVGEFRVHYAGFFDPGFGDPEASGQGSKAVLEVRSFEVPFVIEHGQVVGRLTYEKLASVPTRLYGKSLKSNYQRQGLRLSKHFKQPPL